MRNYEERWVLSREEVAKALFVDEDFDSEELEFYAQSATSFLKNKTGYDWSRDEIIEPLAKMCARQYVQTMYFSGENYKPEFDFKLGIDALLVDLQNLVLHKKNKRENKVVEEIGDIDNEKDDVSSQG